MERSWLYRLSKFIFPGFKFSRFSKTSTGPGPARYRDFTITLRHTALGRTPLDESSARRKDPYLTTHNPHNRQKRKNSGKGGDPKP
jgi:hypothetical protein